MKNCYWKNIARETKKRLEERGIELKVNSFEIKGCYECNGNKPFCEYYYVMEERE